MSELVVDVVPLVRVIPGGQSIGVLLTTHGLRVRDVIGVRGMDGREYYPARDAGIQPGDIIVSIDGQDIHRPEQVSYVVNAAAEQKGELTVVIRRNQRLLTRKVRPIRARRDLYGQPAEMYLLGILLEDLAGSRYPESMTPRGRFGALGHPITDVSGREMNIEGGALWRRPLTASATAPGVLLGEVRFFPW